LRLFGQGIKVAVEIAVMAATFGKGAASCMGNGCPFGFEALP
jgi:hypothetical protein